MVQRKSPEAPSLSRRKPTLAPKIQILVVCEGSTEEDYVRHIADLVGNSLVQVSAIPNVGVPETVVGRAIAERNAMLASAKCSEDSFDGLFSVWAMFDKDDFEVEEPKRNAIANGVKVAFSNPCFELWGLLHLEERMAASSRHDVQSRLKDIMPPYDHNRNPYFDHKRLTEDARNAAINRAQNIRKLRKQDSSEGVQDDPYTSVDKLVLEVLRKSGNMPKIEDLTQEIFERIAELEASDQSNTPQVRKEISRLHKERKSLNTNE